MKFHSSQWYPATFQHVGWIIFWFDYSHHILKQCHSCTEVQHCPRCPSDTGCGHSSLCLQQDALGYHPPNVSEQTSRDHCPPSPFPPFPTLVGPCASPSFLFHSSFPLCLPRFIQAFSCSCAPFPFLCTQEPFNSAGRALAAFLQRNITAACQQKQTDMRYMRLHLEAGGSASSRGMWVYTN